MIVQSFRSVMWVGAVAGAALSCYMVSLRVASERAVLESVESRILVAKRDIRALDTELSTRGRLRQLERWNLDVLALSAPGEDQFLAGEVQLASLTRNVAPPELAAPLVLAVAPKEEREAKPILASFKLRPAKRDDRSAERDDAPDKRVSASPTKAVAKPKSADTDKDKVATKPKPAAKDKAAPEKKVAEKKATGKKADARSRTAASDTPVAKPQPASKKPVVETAELKKTAARTKPSAADKNAKAKTAL